MQKLIAASGLSSRRGAEQLIREGRVEVDGAPAHLGQKVDPRRAVVLVDGVRLPVHPGLVYYLLYKPPGVVTTMHDPQGRPTVAELVPAIPRVHPVGRLDADSEGLILLTNDGDLTNLITHPRHGITKLYTVLVTGRWTPRTEQDLRSGVMLEDGPARPLRLRPLDVGADRALIEVEMGEGRNREVRRMMAAVGHPVQRLVRTAIGPVRDRELAPGGWRPLSTSEVRSLYGAARP